MASFDNSVTAGKGHGLLCPSCRVDLVMSERQGIEIDYCPKCRGVWLDRGELDKIVERSQGQSREQGTPNRAYAQTSSYEHQEASHSHGHSGKSGHRRKSWLSEIFD